MIELKNNPIDINTEKYKKIYSDNEKCQPSDHII